ncbi:MAG: DUF262 domain-containing protein [Alphaproteobacteria bacterium]|nr:DUF262 domain-containing protein [Alphaproteobacteria bacterium]
MKIESGRIINDFFEENKRQYAIPVYQRNYSWSKKQCSKLFDDILYAYQKDKTHFCGSIVYAPLKEENNIHFYIIIDGQQRMTTIYILLKALYDMAQTDREKESIKEILFNNDKFDEYGVEKANKLKLKPINSDDNQLILLMGDSVEKDKNIDKSSTLYQNYTLFCELIREQQENGLTVKDIYRGIEKLICGKMILGDGDNAQEIFERINSTGVPLSLADKIRNFVLMVDKDQEKLYNNYWLEIEKNVSVGQLDDFFITYLNFRLEGFARADEAYELFKQLFEQKKYTNEGILQEMLRYSKYYHTFLNNDVNYTKKANDLLAGLRQLKQTTLFVFLFDVFDDFHNNLIDSNELEKILELLLNYSIRRLVCEIGSNSLRGLYKTLYSRVFSNKEHKQYYYDAILSFLTQLTSKDVFPSNEVFEKALKENNLYRKNALCKYLLASIENSGKEKIDVSNLTIEHILPQNKNLSPYWQKMLGVDWRKIQETYLHTLGNLTLTGYNSELGDKSFEEKLEYFNSSDTKIVTLNEDIKGDIWNETTITTRADNLALKILKQFAIKPAEHIISFYDRNYVEYSSDVPEDATSKSPEYYVFQGERVIARTFAAMLKSLIHNLYEENPSIIENMARNNEKISSLDSYRLFSYDPEMTKGSYQIDDSSIYVSTGFSASHIMRIIGTLLDKYEIDRSDFSYFAKDNKTD